MLFSSSILFCNDLPKLEPKPGLSLQIQFVWKEKNEQIPYYTPSRTHDFEIKRKLRLMRCLIELGFTYVKIFFKVTSQFYKVSTSDLIMYTKKKEKKENSINPDPYVVQGIW